jgi:hypothetical protein
MKSSTLPVILIALSAMPAFAANYIGTGTSGSPGDYGTGTNWDTGTVPALATAGNSVSITNGSTVNYNGATLSDMVISNGNTLTVSAGSTLTAAGSQWAQVNGGTFAIDNGTYSRATFGAISVGQAAGTAGSPVTGVINILNHSTVSMPDVSNSSKIVLSNASNTTSTMNLTDSTIVVGNEFWLGGNGTSDVNEIVNLNINNSSITTKATGSVGLWVWDYADSGNSMHINFNGPAGSFFQSADSIGSRNKGTGGTQTNNITWESLWDLGILTANGGKSGLTGDTFGTYFTTTGTSVRDGGAYTLNYVPEPSGSVLASLTGLLLLNRRRRCAVAA